MTLIEYLFEQNRKALVPCQDWFAIAVIAALIYWALPV